MRKRSEGYYQRLLQNKSQNTEECIQILPQGSASVKRQVQTKVMVSLFLTS